MKDFNEIKKILSTQKSYLEDRFKVKSISIFGSSVRRDQNKDSDIDILIEFSKTVDLFEFIELENFLSEILGSKVDLVMKDALKLRIKDNILKEAVPI